MENTNMMKLKGYLNMQLYDSNLEMYLTIQNMELLKYIANKEKLDYTYYLYCRSTCVPFGRLSKQLQLAAVHVCVYTCISSSRRLVFSSI